MKNKLRYLILLLVLAQLVCVFAACSDRDKPGSVTDDGLDDETYETDDYTKDSIPDQDFPYREITMLLRGQSSDKVAPASFGDGTNELLMTTYSRYEDYKERFNVDINVVLEAGDWAGMGAFNSRVENFLAGGERLDMICAFSLCPSILAVNGYLYNLSDLEYPEVGKAWWSDSVSEWEQHGNLFFIASNSSMSMIDNLEVMFVNQSIFADYSLQNPVDLVLSDEWTYAKMAELVTTFDNTGTDASTLMYGLVVDDFSRMDAFYYSAGFRNTKNNDDGIAEYAVTTQTEFDRITSYIDKLVALFNSSSATVTKDSDNVLLMREKKTAIMVSLLGRLPEMQDTDYTPIPLPKLDETQESYLTTHANGFDMWCIPITAPEPEFSGMLIEGMGSSDYNVIAPFYFEKYLAMRYSANEEGYEIFNMIRSSVVYDFGRISQGTLLGYVAESPFRSCFWDSETDSPYAQNRFVTKYDENKDRANELLADLLKKYANAGN